MWRSPIESRRRQPNLIVPHILSYSIILTGVSPLAVAADNSTASNPDESITEVIVTAERREATIQSTPISITAFRGADLRQAGVTDLQSVAQEVPGVSFKTGGPGQTELEMRGLNSGGGNSPTVGLYLDDIPVSSFAYATAGKVVIDPDLYDLERVEVLRGPQGTLYGAGSMGGAVRLITSRPNLEQFGASGELVGSGTEGGGANGTFNAMVNLPILDNVLALRIVATQKYLSGWIDRIVPVSFPLPLDGGLTRGNVAAAPVAYRDTDVNFEREQAARITLLYQPSDRLSITPMAMYQGIHSGGQSLIDSPPNTEAHYQPFDSPEPVSDEFVLTALAIQYDLNFAELYSTTSYWRRTLTQVQDGAEVMQDVLGLPAYSVEGGGLGADPWVESDSANQKSQEFRLASKGDYAFNWQAGVFYNKLNSTTLQYSVDDAAAALFGVTTLYHELVPQSFDQKAVFGEASYKITPTVKATVGVRYFNFHNTFSTSEYGFFGPYGDLTPGGSSSTEKDNGFNPKFNLAWMPNDDLTSYVTVSKGFRPGGGNQVVPTSGTEEGDACAASLAALGKSTNPTAYEPDTVWNYEAGEKTRLLDGRLSINGSIYYENWRNIQRAVTLTCGYIYSDNAGSASVKGGELEVSAKLSDELTVSLNGAYTHAIYSTTSLEAGVQEGQRLPDVPEFTSSQSLIYLHKLMNGYTLVGRATNDYIGSRQDVNYYTDNLPAYDIASARLGVEAPAGWSLFLFVDNLTNKHALLTAINSEVLNIPTMTRDTTNRPRTIGLDLTYGF